MSILEKIQDYMKNNCKIDTSKIQDIYSLNELTEEEKECINKYLAFYAQKKELEDNAKKIIDINNELIDLLQMKDIENSNQIQNMYEEINSYLKYAHLLKEIENSIISDNENYAKFIENLVAIMNEKELLIDDDDLSELCSMSFLLFLLCSLTKKTKKSFKDLEIFNTPLINNLSIKNIGD